MAANAHVYDQGMKHILAGEIHWENDSIMLAVLDDTYEPDRGVDEFWDDISAHEATADDYPVGGVELDGAAIVVDTDAHTIGLDCDNETLPGPTYPTGHYIIIYKDSGDPATSPLIGYIDLDDNITVSGTTINAAGLATFTLG